MSVFRRTVAGYLARIPFMRKIILIFVVCVLLPLLLMSYFFFTTSSSSMRDILRQQAAGSFDQVALQLNVALEDVDKLLVRYRNNSQINSMIDAEYPSDRAFLTAYQDSVAPIVSYDLSLQSRVEHIMLITDNPSVFTGAYVMRRSDGDVFDRRTEREIYSLPVADNQLSATLHVGYRLPVGTQTSGPFVALSCRMNYYPEQRRYSKLVRVDLNLEAFSELLTDVPLFDGLVVTDEDDRILIAASGQAQTGGTHFDPATLPEGSVLLRRKLNEDLPFILYGYYNAAVVTDDFRHTLLVALGIASGSLLVAIIFLMTIGRDLARRMRSLVRKSERIAQGDFSNQPMLASLETRDEIGQVERSVDELSGQLSAYIQREFESRLAQAEMEKEVTQAMLQALQAQVNPHFLFNALECIRLNALDCDRTETVRMIKYLAQMFRYLVQWEGDIVCLHEELTFLNEFLQIQKYRFGSEFQYRIQVDEEARECLLPKLILQPLVENACVHGIEATSNEKAIDIRVELLEERLYLRVLDTGKGIAPERLEALREDMRTGGGRKSVGLYNVYQRLSLYYQDRFTFTIDSEPEHGTQCTVIIPAAYQKEVK